MCNICIECKQEVYDGGLIRINGRSDIDDNIIYICHECVTGSKYSDFERCAECGEEVLYESDDLELVEVYDEDSDEKLEIRLCSEHAEEAKREENWRDGTLTMDPNDEKNDEWD